MKSKHESVIDGLIDMEDSTVIRAHHKALVARARLTIVAQEKQIEATLAELAKYRAVACMSPEELARWKAGTAMLVARTAPPLGGEWHTLYVKD